MAQIPATVKQVSSSSALAPASLRLLGLAPLAFLLPACAHLDPAPSATASIAPPAHWSQPASAPASAPAAAAPIDVAALESWWHRFDDPVLDQLVADALAHNPDARTALSRIVQARAERSVEASGFFPSVSADVSGQGSRRVDRATAVATTSEGYSAALDATWEIDLFGQQRLAFSAASADLARAEDNFHAVQASLAAEVATAYVNLRSAEAQLDFVRQSLASRSETTDLTRSREQAGLGDALTTRQAVASLKQTRATVPALQQTITEAGNQLAILCGRAPGTLDSLLGGNVSVPAAPADIAVGIPADTLRQRPDVRAADQAVHAAALRSSAARRDRLPSLSLTGSLGVDAAHLGDLFDPASTVASLVGSLTAPIFSAGRITQNIRIQDETTKQALIAYESTVLSALSEVENALSSIRRQRERLDSLQTATSAAREADELARQQYQAGAVDFLTVLDAQRTLLSLEQNLVSTRADLTTAHIQLYKALGGGWSASTPTTAVASSVDSAAPASASASSAAL